VPFETQIAVAGLHRQPRDLSRLYARAMHVELSVAETVCKTNGPCDEFGTHHLDVKLVRALPFADVNDAVIEAARYRHRL
jgi:hypothetical protein